MAGIRGLVIGSFWQSVWWLLLTVVASLGLLVGLLIIIAFLLLMDRKVWAAVQLRRGPNVVGSVRPSAILRGSVSSSC